MQSPERYSTTSGERNQSAELSARLAATVGLIGVGEGNGYGHPTDALLEVLAASGTTALRIDRDGLVLDGFGPSTGRRCRRCAPRAGATTRGGPARPSVAA